MVRRLWFSFLVPLTVFGQQWSRLSDFPGSKRDDGAAAVLNGRAYFGTGLQEGWTSTSDWYSFDLYTLAWKKLPDMPPSTGRQYACGFSALNSIFIFGGDAYGGRNDMFRYDPVEEKWQGCAAKPGAGVMAAASMTFGDKVFFYRRKSAS